MMPMSEHVTALAERIDDRFGSLGVQTGLSHGELTAEVPAERLLDVCRALRDEPAFGFEMLMDLCGVDYAAYGQAEWKTSEVATGTGFSRGVERGLPIQEQPRRFAVVIHLLSLSHNLRLRLRSYAQGMPARVPSVTGVWNSANWYEREAFDMVGILFDGHPDLRRLLSDYGFNGHPLRKDFPTSGYVEMRYDAEKQRVIYQPVTIEPRTLVPRTIRDDNRYHTGEPTGDKS